MNSARWQVLFIAVLVLLSGGLYALHYVAFHDLRNVLFYGVMDLAFLPLQVLMATLVIARILAYRERLRVTKKINMVIGAFYSEVGNVLLRHLMTFDAEPGRVREKLTVRADWSRRQYGKAMRQFRTHPWRLDCRQGDLAALRQSLASRRGFLLGLLESPSLTERETFTELLWAVFHLTEELEARPDLTALPDTDCAHLTHDMVRAYRWLVVEWLGYLQNLSRDYPYLYSLAQRMNPFDAGASVIIR